MMLFYFEIIVDARWYKFFVDMCVEETSYALFVDEDEVVVLMI